MKQSKAPVAGLRIKLMIIKSKLSLRVICVLCFVCFVCGVCGVFGRSVSASYVFVLVFLLSGVCCNLFVVVVLFVLYRGLWCDFACLVVSMC